MECNALLSCFPIALIYSLTLLLSFFSFQKTKSIYSYTFHRILPNVEESPKDDECPSPILSRALPNPGGGRSSMRTQRKTSGDDADAADESDESQRPSVMISTPCKMPSVIISKVTRVDDPVAHLEITDDGEEGAGEGVTAALLILF